MPQQRRFSCGVVPFIRFPRRRETGTGTMKETFLYELLAGGKRGILCSL